MTVKITPNDKGNPPGKLAEAEIHFDDGYLQGLKLVGFAIWERKSGSGRNVTFPGADDPAAVAQAIHAIVHQSISADEAITMTAQNRDHEMDFFTRSIS